MNEPLLGDVYSRASISERSRLGVMYFLLVVFFGDPYFTFEADAMKRNRVVRS